MSALQKKRIKVLFLCLAVHNAAYAGFPSAASIGQEVANSTIKEAMSSLSAAVSTLKKPLDTIMNGVGKMTAPPSDPAAAKQRTMDLMGIVAAAGLLSYLPSITGGSSFIGKKVSSMKKELISRGQKTAAIKAQVGTAEALGAGLSSSMQDQAIALQSATAVHAYGSTVAHSCDPVRGIGGMHHSMASTSAAIAIKPLNLSIMKMGSFAPIAGGTDGDVNHVVSYGSATAIGDTNYLSGRSFISKESADQYFNKKANDHPETILPHNITSVDPRVPSCDIDAAANTAGTCRAEYMKIYVARLLMPEPSPELSPSAQLTSAGTHYQSLITERAAKIALAQDVLFNQGLNNDPNILLTNLGTTKCTTACQPWQSDLTDILGKEAVTVGGTPAVSLNQVLAGYAQYVSSSTGFFERIAGENSDDMAREALTMNGIQTMMLYKTMHAVQQIALIAAANYGQNVEHSMQPLIDSSYAKVP